MCVNSEGSGKTAQMRRLAWAFAGRLCNKYQNLMSWLISAYTHCACKKRWTAWYFGLICQSLEQGLNIASEKILQIQAEKLNMIEIC